MGNVVLKSRIGPFGPITRTTRIQDPRLGYRYERIQLQWSLDDDCRVTVPEKTWEEMKDDLLYADQGLKFKDVLIPL